MRRVSLAVLSFGAGLLLIPASSSAANVEAYVACSSTAEAEPSHVCLLGDETGAFFESDEEVEYEVCVEFPDGEEECLEEQVAEAETLYVNEFTYELPGASSSPGTSKASK